MTEELMPLAKMRDRLKIEGEESDTSIFLNLMYLGELLTKLTVAGFVAAVQDDRDRQKYRAKYKFVRAVGIGDWSSALLGIVTGPTAALLDHEMSQELRQATEKVGASEWQSRTLNLLAQAAHELAVELPEVQSRVSLQGWFASFAMFRNKTRGHGAPKAGLCAKACAPLQESLDLIISNFSLFSRPWAYLHHCLSGKYRVTHLGGPREPFETYKRRADHPSLEDGVYIFLSQPRLVELLSFAQVM